MMTLCIALRDEMGRREERGVGRDEDKKERACYLLYHES